MVKLPPIGIPLLQCSFRGTLGVQVSRAVPSCLLLVAAAFRRPFETQQFCRCCIKCAIVRHATPGHFPLRLKPSFSPASFTTHTILYLGSTLIAVHHGHVLTILVSAPPLACIVSIAEVVGTAPFLGGVKKSRPQKLGMCDTQTNRERGRSPKKANTTNVAAAAAAANMCSGDNRQQQQRLRLRPTYTLSGDDDRTAAMTSPTHLSVVTKSTATATAPTTAPTTATATTTATTAVTGE